MHQLLTLIPRHQFEKLVDGLDTDRYVKTFTTTTIDLCLNAFP
ncbi:MAG: DUF4372 domain-containing protein [Elusimicrobia bacterium]|nr:DUF4372 domain-containing protein [Elusimicrobiota bacterium]